MATNLVRFCAVHAGVNSHLATRLDQAGLSARAIADYLGHERISMTQDVYLSRQTTGVAAAAALGLLGPNESMGYTWGRS